MDTLMTPAAVAEKTGFTTKTLANWRTLGQGPAWFKIGRHVRYDEAAVEAWLNEVRSTP